MARTKRAKRGDGGAIDRTGQRKVTMWLPSDLARRLRHVAVEDDTDIGQVAAPGIELALAGQYWVKRERRAGQVAAPAVPPRSPVEPDGPAVEPVRISA